VAVAPTGSTDRPSFEVASIKVNKATENRVFARLAPGRYTATGATARMLINFAYNVKNAQVSGGPSWVNTEKFDIDAKEEDSVAQQLQKMPPEQASEQVRLMVQSLLAERFGLVVSRPTKEMPIYALVVAKGGAKLTPTKSAPLPNGFPTAGAMPPPPSPNSLSVQPEFSDRVMVDETGLTAKYDISLQWTPENPMPALNPSEPAPDPNGPSLFTALEELGLHVESAKGPVETLVIEQVEEPSEN